MEAPKKEVLEETGIKNPVGIIEGVYRFELSTPLHEKEFVYGVEVLRTKEIELDNNEHSKYRWRGFEEALNLLKLKKNKVALRKDEILSKRAR